jgi:hypothetical protein
MYLVGSTRCISALVTPSPVALAITTDQTIQAHHGVQRCSFHASQEWELPRVQRAVLISRPVKLCKGLISLLEVKQLLVVVILFALQLGCNSRPCNSHSTPISKIGQLGLYHFLSAVLAPWRACEAAACVWDAFIAAFVAGSSHEAPLRSRCTTGRYTSMPYQHEF